MLLEPVHAIIAFPFYREVTKRSLARAVLYLACVNLAYAGLVTFAIYRHLDPPFRRIVEWTASSMPTLKLSGGRLSGGPAAPLRIENPEVPRLAVMVDTGRTGPVGMEELRAADVSVYLAGDAAYVLRVLPPRPGTGAEPGAVMRSFDFAAHKAPVPVVLDADFYRGIGRGVRTVFYPAAFAICLVFFFLWRVAASFAYSALGVALDSAMDTALPYADLLKLAAYVQTPVILLDCVLLFVPDRLPAGAGFLIGWLVAGVYTWQALRQHPRRAPAGPGEEA